MSNFGPICSELGPAADGAGHPRPCAALTAPAALAWIIANWLGSLPNEYEIATVVTREAQV